MLICIYPFYYLLIVSMSDSLASDKGLVYLWPVKFTLQYYKQTFALKGIAQSFFISISRSVLGTAISVFMSAMFAYTITKLELPGRKLFYRATVMTMYLNSGLIPWFITMKTYGLADNFLLYILPGAISAFSVILIKTYMESLPVGLEESAFIDGAGMFSIFVRIALPLSKPVLAAIGLFTAVGQWNSWQDNFFLVSAPNLQTLQKVLMDLLRQAEAIANMIKTGQAGMAAMATHRMTPFTAKTTITMITVIPIICVYPFLQKYFVKGMLVGAIKG